MRLIVGLGNPGADYSNSRHNVGFLCINRLARRHGMALKGQQGRARTGIGEIGGEAVVLAKPQTYVNNSGESVSMLLDRLTLDPDDLIVIYDDFSLPLGKMRIRRGGGSGGHNGMKSIIASLGSQEFPRIRVGIGRPASGGAPNGKVATSATTYVLGDFTPEERALVNEVTSTVSDAVDCIFTEGIEVAMNRFNSLVAPSL